VIIYLVEKFIPKNQKPPAYLDNKELFRRTGPRTDKVPDGPETARFIIERISIKN